MIIIGGPYIGNFEHEVMTFKPYILWLMRTLTVDDVFVNTHKNRAFLYDFIPEENIIPIYEHISRDEMGQVGYIHEQVAQKDFQSFMKDLKNNVCELTECNKRDIGMYNLSYVRSTPHYSIYNKTFSKIVNLDIENPYKGKIVFIPYEAEDFDVLLEVKMFLENYDTVIAGDKRTAFNDENPVLSMIDYYENGWKLIIKIITEAAAVVCPLSFWTTICNLQQAPVFSWGKNVGQHRSGGIYHFGNDKCMTVSLENIDSVLNMLEHFLEEINNV
jgi:hypothetical protein